MFLLRASLSEIDATSMRKNYQQELLFPANQESCEYVFTLSVVKYSDPKTLNIACHLLSVSKNFPDKNA